MHWHGLTDFVVREAREVGEGKGPMAKKCTYNKFSMKIFWGLIYNSSH